MTNVKCWFHKDMQDVEYSYNELDTIQELSAIASIYYMLRDSLGFSLKSYKMDKDLIICIIKKIKPTFDELGMIVKFSRKYEKLTVEIVELIYEECRKQKNDLR